MGKKKKKTSGVMTSSNKKVLKYEAATITSISYVQFSGHLTMMQREKFLFNIFFKTLTIKLKEIQGFLRLILK